MTPKAENNIKTWTQCKKELFNCPVVWTEAKRLVRRAYFLGEWNMCSYTVRLQFPQLSALSMVCKTCILGTGDTPAKDLSSSGLGKMKNEVQEPETTKIVGESCMGKSQRGESSNFLPMSLTDPSTTHVWNRFKER